MVNYENGKIYKIESHIGDKIYVGSTTKQYLSQRMDKHRSSYKYWKNGKADYVTSYGLFDEYGLENCKIVLLEACECKSKDELHAREAHYIKLLTCVNKKILGLTKAESSKKYTEANKERIKIYEKQNRQKNSESIKARKAIKYTCECGSCLVQNNKSYHIKTKKHINYINSLQ